MDAPAEWTPRWIYPIEAGVDFCYTEPNVQKRHEAERPLLAVIRYKLHKSIRVLCITPSILGRPAKPVSLINFDAGPTETTYRSP